MVPFTHSANFHGMHREFFPLRSKFTYLFEASCTTGGAPKFITINPVDGPQVCVFANRAWAVCRLSVKSCGGNEEEVGVAERICGDRALFPQAETVPTIPLMRYFVFEDEHRAILAQFSHPHGYPSLNPALPPLSVGIKPLTCVDKLLIPRASMAPGRLAGVD
ncbi:hypothetical protein VH13_10710 [Corynebacterium ulcerans]|nr:hypothetical protein VH13_10710 [Corynebacterium ulcerans]